LCDEPADQNQFYVKDRYNISTLTPEKVYSELERVADKLCRNGGSKCLEIINNDYFDFLYSVIYYLDDQSNKIRKQIIQTLQLGLKNLKHYIDMRKMQEYSESNLLTTHMSKNQDQLQDNQFKIIILIQNSLKAYTYLITWYMSDFSKLKDSKDIGTKGKRKKAKEQTSTSELELNAIMVAQKECLKIFLQFMDTSIHTFFPDHKIDEDFVNLFIKTGFDMLEN
jgi:hypothetical protein